VHKLPSFRPAWEAGRLVLVRTGSRWRRASVLIEKFVELFASVWVHRVP